MSRIGILHPGEMGISIAASALNNGHEVYWVSTGRSYNTRLRAEKHHLIELNSLSELCRIVEIVICICPPAAAEEVARAVIEAGFTGLYLDANAIAPQRSISLGQQIDATGIRYVDGSIIGGPAWTPKETWLYLSGVQAGEVARLFSKGPLEAKILGDKIGKASALKMCYAAYSKGTTALLAAILAAADTLGVREDLFAHWDMDQIDFSEKVTSRVTHVTAKAWRFEGEMREIAATLREAGLPGEFHDAAAEVYRRMANFKNLEHIPSLEELVKSLSDK